MYNYKPIEKIEDMVVGKVYADMAPSSHHVSFLRFLGIENERLKFEFIRGAHNELYLESSDRVFFRQKWLFNPGYWVEIEDFVDIDFEEIEYSFVVTALSNLTDEERGRLDNLPQDQMIGVINSNEIIGIDSNGEKSIMFTFKWSISRLDSNINSFRSFSIGAAKKVLDNLNIKYQ
jgi:hypothetical protein